MKHKNGVTIMNNEEVAVRFLKSRMGYKHIINKSCSTCKYNEHGLCCCVKWLHFSVSNYFVCDAYVSVANGQSNTDIKPVEVDEP